MIYKLSTGSEFVGIDGLRVRSRWWYLLPILFNVIGGVIAYFVLRDDDPRKAKNCLWLGIILTAINIVSMVIVFAIFDMNKFDYWSSYPSV